MKIEIDESRLSAGERRFLRDIMAKTKQAPEPELELDANGSPLWCRQVYGSRSQTGTPLEACRAAAARWPITWRR
jgi:hypothetical protein